MDYGHPIKFGTFVTPGNATPQAPVQLAQLSESLGYDLVTFQDHPYQPGFHDTLSLISYVAAQTSTIHIAPNVLNLPLRPAPVMARAIASIDLLSGGRIDLGLGAGGFLEAIQAMGGPTLTHGQAVTALSEAIDIIRGIWNPADRSVLRGDGFYSVEGAKRGPLPAHEIPIWLGAKMPRMLRLTGRKADGWLPSLPWLTPADIVAGNATIDEAATEAGREPSEIVRLLNVGGAITADELVKLALESGFSTFIVMGDDPRSMQQFAEEVAPVVRAAVAAERASSGVVAAGRSARAIALRREGIAYDEVPESLRDAVVEPGDFAYPTVKSTYMRGGNPGLVLRPRTVAEVTDALAFARRHPDLPLGVRSGGHGISGRSTNDGGLVIDLKALDSIEVLDADARLVRIGPGARWMDVAAALEPHGLALSSGDYGGVGVGGLATAGGIGFLARDHGLTIDHLVGADVLLADGSVVRASAEENPELFFGIRGAGANFGIVLSFDFVADPVGDVGWVQLVYDASDTAAFLERFGTAMEESPRDVTAFLILGGHRPGQPQAAQLYGVVNSSDPDTIIEHLQPLASIGPLLQQSVQLMPYAAVMANAADSAHDGQGEPQFRSGLVEHLDGAVAEASAALIETGSSPWYQIRSVGGAVADVPADATAYAHRSANFSITAIGRSSVFTSAWERLAENFDGLYLSFESTTGSETVAQAFPPETLARLRDLKRRYDPENVFRDNFNVGIEAAVTG